MRSDVTPEVKQAAVKAVCKAVPDLNPWDCVATINILLSLGWRAPGPLTDAEVERAARALIREWACLMDGNDPDMTLGEVRARAVRAALTAALQGEGRDD